MEGVSSQSDILSLVAQMRQNKHHDFLIIASHRSKRMEILAEADVAYIEPEDDHLLLSFITLVSRQHRVRAIHAGKRGELIEKLRNDIEALGIKLTTGAKDEIGLALADNKTRFSETMMTSGLPAVPSIEVSTPDEVQSAIATIESQGLCPCIKPVHGIYGMGFWILKRAASRLSFFNNPNNRQINTQLLINALQSAQDAGETLPLQIVMPYLPGPERSVDMLVEQGRVIAAVARKKEGSHQTFEMNTPAYQLAVRCAAVLGADGLINIQTRDDNQGNPVLLEANLRPSGGIGYTALSNLNLPGLFALRQLELISDDEVLSHCSKFTSATVLPTHSVKPLPVCTVTSYHELVKQAQQTI